MVARRSDQDDELINRNRERILERLRRGGLPRDRYEGMWGAQGSGLPCAGCGEPIGSDDLEIEAQFLTATGFEGHRFHTLCHAIWEIERRRS